MRNEIRGSKAAKGSSRNRNHSWVDLAYAETNVAVDAIGMKAEGLIGGKKTKETAASSETAVERRNRFHQKRSLQHHL